MRCTIQCSRSNEMSLILPAIYASIATPDAVNSGPTPPCNIKAVPSACIEMQPTKLEGNSRIVVLSGRDNLVVIKLFKFLFYIRSVLPGLQSFRLEFRISPSHLGAFWPDFSLIQLVEFGGILARVSHITNTPSCIVDILCFSCIWSALGWLAI